MSTSAKSEITTVAELRAQLEMVVKSRDEAVTKYADLKEATSKLDSSRVRQIDELRKKLSDVSGSQTVPFSEALRRVGLGALSMSFYGDLHVVWDDYPQPFSCGSYFVVRGDRQPFNARRSRENAGGGSVLFRWSVVGSASGEPTQFRSAWVSVCRDENRLGTEDELYLRAGLS